MKQVSTACARDCYDTCSLVVTLGESGGILSVRGDPDHPVTRGITCPRGTKDHERLLKNRVEVPFMRGAGRLEKVGWERSLSAVSQRLSEVLGKYGPEAVLYLDYAGNTGLLTTVFPRRLWNAVGATQTDWALCSKSGHDALALHYGESHGIDAVEILSARLVVFWGFNAAASSPHMWSLAREARKVRGASIVAIDPRESETAASADLWIQPMPGSDVALAYGVFNHLIQNEYVDPGFVEEWTLGFGQLGTEARKWTPERVERVTGVPWKHIEQLGELYGNSSPAATMIGIGLQKCDRGADQVRATSFIPALLGSHRGFFYSSGHSFFVNEPLISGRTLTGKTPRIVEQVAIPELVKRGEFKFIFVTCMNPAMTLPNQHAFREGMLREDVFVVIHETHWTKTTEYADVILPAPTFLEKEDLVIPWGHKYVRFSERAVSPVTDSRTEVWVMREIAERLGLKEEWLFEDAWNAVETAVGNAFEGGDSRTLRSGEMLTLRTRPKKEYPTPSGKIEFCSSRATEMGLSPLPTQAQLCPDRGKFILLTSATPEYTNTQFQEVYGPIPAVVSMNFRDAGRLGIEEGDVASIVNDRGQVRVKVTVSDTILEGVLWAPRQSEGLTGEPLNCLMSSDPQEIGSGPRFNSTTVTVTKPEITNRDVS